MLWANLLRLLDLRSKVTSGFSWSKSNFIQSVTMTEWIKFDSLPWSVRLNILRADWTSSNLLEQEVQGLLKPLPGSGSRWTSSESVFIFIDCCDTVMKINKIFNEHTFAIFIIKLESNSLVLWIQIHGFTGSKQRMLSKTLVTVCFQT